MNPGTLGVVGTLVWDRFVGALEPDGPVEEWGGIAYALGALSASLADGWSILPIVKVGRDLAEPAVRFLREIPRVDTSGVVVVADANNRVELRYESASRRTERLSGGVPPWSWRELAPRVGRCDALHVNFISGFELGLEDARALCAGFDGPTYADLHSLFLGIDARGMRVPRPLPDAAEWLRCFDAVQLNEEELELLTGGPGPWTRAEALLGARPRLVAVTLGARGAAAVTASGLDPDPTDRRRGAPSADGSRAERVEAPTEARRGDPTGCGDVWGAALHARLLSGDGLVTAMGVANRLGGLNVEHRGARGLAEHFLGPRAVPAGGARET